MSKSLMLTLVLGLSLSSAFAQDRGAQESHGPAQPPTLSATASVDIGSSQADQDTCADGSSEEAQAAMKLALKRAAKLSCPAGSPTPVEPGAYNPTQTDSGWVCVASALLPCR